MISAQPVTSEGEQPYNGPCGFVTDLGPSQAPAPPLTAPTRVSNRKKRSLATRGFLQIEKRPFRSKVIAPESLRILKFAVIGELPGGTL